MNFAYDGRESFVLTTASAVCICALVSASSAKIESELSLMRVLFLLGSRGILSSRHELWTLSMESGNKALFAWAFILAWCTTLE